MTAARKHILVTTDFSEESFAAFEPVARLARDIGARVTLLHTVPEVEARPTGTPFVSPVKIPTVEDQLPLALSDLEKLRPKFGAGVDLTVDATGGPSVREAILDYAEQHDVDILAMATHGRSGLRRLVMGSIVEEVLRHSQVPVLVIPLHGCW